MKKAMALILALTLSLGLLAGCSQQGSSPTGGNNTPTDVPSYASLKVGEDYTDISAELRVISHRTDLIDSTFAKYAEEFNKLYPNVKITYEGITNYADDMTTRISSNNWGDICMVPTTIQLPDLGLYFHPLCSLSEIEADYNFATNRAYDGTVYGIPSTGNAQGIVYNKKVAEAAGYTADNMPKTPDEFIKFLQDIKDKTDAIPLYTNFAAGWTMGAWDAYIGGGATGDPDWMNITMPQTKDVFADRGDGTGPYAVYKLLYDAVSMGLTEDSPTATDWEGCKPMMNNGEIGTLVLGSWAIIQMQEVNMDNADGVARTTDFKTFTRLENPFIPFNRNAVLFPRKINGMYAMLSRPSNSGHTPLPMAPLWMTTKVYTSTTPPPIPVSMWPPPQWTAWWTMR